MRKKVMLIALVLILVVCGIIGCNIDNSTNIKSSVEFEDNILENAEETNNNDGSERNDEYELSMFTIFDYNDVEVFEFLGDKYEIVPAGAEGSYDGYYYDELGITIVFDYYGKIEFIECTDKYVYNGVSTGMSFEEIQAILGKSEIDEGWYETPDNKVYSINYSIDGVIFNFISFETDYSESYLTVYPGKIDNK